MPWTVERAIQFDATVNRGEAFEWSGFRFHIEQQPGQPGPIHGEGDES